MQKNKTKAVALVVVLVVIVVALIITLSGSKNTNNQANQNQMTNTNSNDNLQVTDEVMGTGTEAVAGDLVTVNYVGTLANGTVFDASASHGNQGFTFLLGAGQVIKGWDEGVAGMKVGGKRKLVIPSDLAYGSNGIPGVIPPNSTLIFEVGLLSVKQAGQ